MAADHEGKTEAPSEKRLSEAKARGQIAKAPELGMALALLVGGALLKVEGARIAVNLAELTVSLFRNLDPQMVRADNVAQWTREAALCAGALVLPFAAACAVASLVAGFAQSRFSLAPEALMPSWSKLDPIAGAGRIFAAAGVVRILLDLLKIIVAVSILWGGVQALLREPLFGTLVPADQLGALLAEHASDILVRLAGATGVLGGFHYLYQWWKTRRDLSMTQQEVKEEMKEANGDPMVKMVRRQMARRLMQKQMIEAVPTADVVITNPTHFAVALKYERGRDDAPLVLAKGEGAFAQRLKAVAREHEVPMVENRPVARALYKYGKVGHPIPGPLYRAVAEILGYVYRTHRYYFHRLKARRWEAEGRRR